MRAQAFDHPSRISPARTVALATAFSVHIAAMLFLLAPARPQAQAQLDDPTSTSVIFVDPPIAPPPLPPPVEPPPTPPLVTRISPPPPLPLPPVAPVDPCGDCNAVDDSPLVTDIPVSDPVPPPGPSNDSFSDARADARYGRSNHVRYPRVAMINREQGEVQLRVLIGRNGAPLQVELARSSGSRSLDSAAKKSVMGWRFVPAERAGEAVEAWVIVPIRFNLNEA